MRGTNNWTVVAAPVEKKKLHMVQVPRDDWCDEFGECERRIFVLLSGVFPKGLTAEEIATRINAEGAMEQKLTAADVGDLLYGDKDDVSDELVPYVVPVNPKQRPKRWRIRATTDPEQNV